MSRGFVREEDQEEAAFIPPRAALPPEVTNYVTHSGYQQLLAEKRDLENQRHQLDIKNDKERRHALAVIQGKLDQVQERLNTARIIKPEKQPHDEVRFGALVSIRFLQGSRKDQELSFSIVGVDEADIRKEKIAFIAPLARAITGKQAGEKVSFQLGKNVELFEILEIHYG